MLMGHRPGKPYVVRTLIICQRRDVKGRFSALLRELKLYIAREFLRFFKGFELKLFVMKK